MSEVRQILGSLAVLTAETATQAVGHIMAQAFAAGYSDSMATQHRLCRAKAARQHPLPGRAVVSKSLDTAHPEKQHSTMLHNFITHSHLQQGAVPVCQHSLAWLAKCVSHLQGRAGQGKIGAGQASGQVVITLSNYPHLCKATHRSSSHSCPSRGVLASHRAACSAA